MAMRTKNFQVAKQGIYRGVDLVTRMKHNADAWATQAVDTAAQADKE
ncbi:MAG: hypothetical protein ACI867_000384 [Glaciecola sp.]|jgi:hypothetical protein